MSNDKKKNARKIKENRKEVRRKRLKNDEGTIKLTNKNEICIY